MNSGGESDAPTLIVSKYAAPLAMVRIAANSFLDGRAGKFDAPSLSSLLPVLGARVYGLLSARSAPRALPLAGMLAQSQQNNAVFESQIVPLTMQAGQTYSTTVTMRNTGMTTWGPGESYRLGSRNPQDNTNWAVPGCASAGCVAGGRVYLPGPVAPGESISLTFNAKARVPAGVYNFQWQMVRDGYEWFGQASQSVAVNVTADGTYTPPAAGALVVSEFRTSGPGGAYDEFVELYNKTGLTLTVSTPDGSSGWALAALMPDGTTQTRFVVPAGTVLPAAGNFLAANQAYSLSSTAVPDVAYTGDIPDGAAVALFRTSNPANFTAANRLDAVAFAGIINPLFLEGTPLTPVGAVSVQHSFVRNMSSGSSKDTNSNSADFLFLSTTAGSFGGVASVLGAPGAAGMTSPLQRNGAIATSYIDPMCTGTGAATSACFRARDLTPVTNGAQGTLSIRRRWTNNTGAPVLRLRFRTVDITTLNSPGYAPGGAQADMRLLNSAAIQVTKTDGTPVTIQGTTLEEPSSEAMGGGLTSTASVGTVTMLTPLAPGNSVNVQFLLGVQQGGTYRFMINVEGDLGALGTPTGLNAVPTDDDFATARLDPANRTGGAGVDLRSGNYNWGLPLVSLKGRAGLDLGLSLAYNSRVWTKSGSHITFDADNGSPSPGFRLGFPTIQPRFTNTQTGKRTYLLITPSGDRVELRATGTAGLYESADSSYLQLTESGGGLVLRPTDGSQMTFVSAGGEYVCTRVKDRNGNYLDAAYDATGRLAAVTDTLGRVVKLNYDKFQNLISITQRRWNDKSQAYYDRSWATFGWGELTIDTNFSGLTQVGLRDGSTIPVLTQVGLPDGSLYRFEYTTWGQVNLITRYTPKTDETAGRVFPQDYAARSSVSYAVRNDDGAESDCPRISATAATAENWVGGGQVVTGYDYDPGGLWGEATLPDSTRHKEHFGTGWQQGLTVKTESFAAGDSPAQPRKTTTTDWEQNSPELGYALNPRVTKTLVEDLEGNGRQTSFEYDSSLQNYLPLDARISAAEGNNDKMVGLPSKIIEADKNGAVIRYTSVTYKLDEAYVSKRMIGLPAERTLRDAGDVLASKVTYLYDQPDEPGTPGVQYLQESNASLQYNPTVQHDPAYGLSYAQGKRGNLNVVLRWSVSNARPSTEPEFVASKIGYNTHGSVVLSVDPAGHRSAVEYGDSFSRAAMNGAKFAYPTTVTDADGFSSKAVYDYDSGAVTETKSPKPDQMEKGIYGPARTMLYDKADRIFQITSAFDGSYTRWVYPASLMSAQTYTLLKAGTPAVESFSAQVFDGAGRVVGATRNMAEAGHYSGQTFIYDHMGRLVQQSNPTETTGAAGWPATGDDDPANGGEGWVYSEQAYDWKGRPTLTTNQDGTTSEASYGGCGCAGGEVVTVEGETVMLPPQGAEAYTEGKRRQKIYHDVLGRAVKREVLNRDDTPYVTTVTEYNALDQVTGIKEYKGAPTANGSCPSGTCQVTLSEYDGHGRLEKHRAPAQTAPTKYSYYDDDAIRVEEDPRGATATFIYNDRHLLTNTSFAAPSPIPATAPASFAYDAAGNRTQMTDGTGGVTYHYDQLSRMDWEERTFAGLSVAYRLSYGYNLAGQLTSLGEPAQLGASVSYAYDPAGALSGVTGAGFAGGVTQLTSGMKYRAWGALKEMDYGSGLKLSNGFNSRLRPTSYQVKTPNTPAGQGEAARSSYEYNADGRIAEATDHTDTRFNRSYVYDHVGRLTNATAGDSAYYQSFSYDAFGNLTARGNGSWRYHDTTLMQYSNNRNTQTTVYRPGAQPQVTVWAYDAAGNVVHDHNKDYTFDAAGDKRRVFENSGSRYLWLYQDYDGDGERAKRVEQTQPAGGPVTTVTSYYLRSSVLGGKVVAELNEQGAKRESYVYANGEVVAQQKDGEVRFVHVDPVTGSLRETGGYFAPRVEYDPLGNDVPLQDPAPPDEPTPDYLFAGTYGSGGNTYDGASGCAVDGQPIECSFAARLVSTGAAGVCPDNRCKPGVILTDDGFSYGRSGTGGDVLGVWDARTGAGWQKRRQRPRRAGTQRPQRRQSPQTPASLAPNGLASNRGKLSEEDCNEHLRKIFGGDGAVVSTVNEPPDIHKAYRGNRVHHLADNGTIHIYGNKYATTKDAPLFAPANGIAIGGGEYYERNIGAPIPSNEFRFSYSGGKLEIKFNHVGSTHGGRHGGGELGDYSGASPNQEGSIRIGNIAGLGGSATSGFYHTHIEFRIDGKLTDPRKIFCGY